MRSLKSRLERLAINVSNLRNFNYADRYGLTERNVQGLIASLIRDFPGAFIDRPGALATLLEPHIMDLKHVEDSKLTEREKEFKKLYGILKSDDSYRKLLDAYRKGDQVGIRRALPHVFLNPRISDIVNGSHISELFHGVSVPDGMSPKDYLELCLSIQRDGIRNSPYRLHMNMDHTVRHVFTTPNHYNAHGILFFSFRPNGYTVALDKSLTEARIYTPRLKVPMRFNLRGAETLPSYGPDEGVIEVSQAEDYIKELERRLTEKSITFKRLGIPKD
mgnify:CR=1 FL=1